MEFNKSNNLSFNYILVIESLPERERTGKELFSSILERRTQQVEGGAWYENVYGMDDLKGAFDLIKYIYHKYKLLPLIHIEAHGSPEGIVLESGEFVHWIGVSFMITEINALSKNQTVVVLACCHGANIHKAAHILLRCPYNLIIAPVEEATFEDIQVGFTEFYEKLFSSLDFSIEGVNSTNFLESFYQLLDTTESKFTCVTADALFEARWIDFREEFKTEEEYDRLAEKQLDAYRIPEFDRARVKNNFLRFIRNEEEAKASYYQGYMMLE